MSVFGSDMQNLLPTQDLTVEMWTKWVAGGSDWAGPISASQDDGGTERGWNIQTRCKNADGGSVGCDSSRRVEFSLSTAKTNDGDGAMAYLGYPGDASRCTFDSGEAYFAPLDGDWTHIAYNYDGATMNLYVNGVLTQSDSTTAGGAIVYPPNTYEANQGGWFTIGAYHDANEYYSFPGAIDELKVWHVAQAPSMGCDVTGADLNYYWQFNDNAIGDVADGTSFAGTVGPAANSAGGLTVVAGSCQPGGSPMDPSAFVMSGSAKLDGAVLSITQVAGSQLGTAYAPVTATSADGVNVMFEMYTGDGTGADGLCMTLGKNSLDGRAGEDGVAIGVSVCFDEWANNGDHVSRVFSNGVCFLSGCRLDVPLT
jgi:hypothetical protein